METKNLKIISGKFILRGILFLPKNHIDVGIIFLHGGGHANADRYHNIQKFFCDRGIASLAIDFRGCGNSRGNMSESTLLDRIIDAKSSLDVFKKVMNFSDNHIFMWGSSMGGHVASRLISQHLNLRGLILQSAAAYGPSSEHINFGPKFTEAIQAHESWKDSLAFTELSTYSGPTLILYGKNDQVVPDEIKKQYAVSAQNTEYHILTGYGHPMLKPETKEEKAAWTTMVNLGLNFIKKV